jgi:hypothetical protein
MNYRQSPTGQMLSEVAYTDDPQEIELLKTPISRWGRMWQDWVRTEYPTEVSVLIMTGRWNIIPREIDRQAENRFSELDELYRRENSRPVTFSEMQMWEKNRLLTIEHRIMEEIIYQRRS